MLVGTIILSARDQTTLDFADAVDILWRNLVVAAYLGALGVGDRRDRAQPGRRDRRAADLPVRRRASRCSASSPDVAKYIADQRRAERHQSTSSFDDGETDFLDPGIAALVMFGWMTVLFAAGAVLLRRRDLT